MRTLWSETSNGTHFPTLARKLQVDVAVVGGGIAGLTAAWLLKRAGRSVAVIEARSVAGGESCHTSAHLTAVQDMRFKDIAFHFGRAGAANIGRGGRNAIALVERTCRELAIDCDFARVPGWLFTERQKQLRELEKEAEAATRAGFRVELVERAPLPFGTEGALRFDDQAIFHPRKYLLGLADAVDGDGCHVFEHSRVLSVDDGKPCKVHTPMGTVLARDVIIATDAPVTNRVFLHTKLTPQRTYLVTALLDAPLPGLFWDTEDPYHYLRTWEGPQGPVLLAGGEDHRVGEVEDTSACSDRLENWVHQRFGAVEVEQRWSGQVNEPADGLPYIGRNSLSFHVYVATGFSGTGLVNGTIAGSVLCAEILGQRHALGRLLAATRIHPIASAKEVISHNADSALRFTVDRVAPAEVSSLDEIRRGEGRIARVEGHRLAVYRDEEGALHAMSPTCTHLGCQVHWNDAERSWDCPCHGSRFGCTGEVLHGPAVSALHARELPEEEAPGVFPPTIPADEGEHPR